MTVKELSAVFATLPVKLRCFYNDHELDYSLSEYADMEVLDVIDFAIQKERDESIFGNPRIVTYSNTLVLDVLIGDRNEYINAIISTVAKYHAVSPEGLLEAWNEMEQHKDICYAKTAYDIINALGWLADLYDVYGEKAGRVLRRVWICTECHHEDRSLADYIERSFSQTDNPRSHYQVLKQIIWENSEKENGEKIAQW